MMQTFTFTLMVLTAAMGVGVAVVTLLLFVGTMTIRQLERLEGIVFGLAIFALGVVVATMATPAI